jgi:hypothetical protein
MTKIIGIAAVISGLMLSTAFAQVTPPTPPAPTANNVPGIARYDANPGRQQATAVGAQCGSGAGSGAFGFLGTDSSMAGGANGVLTGINNSSVCGNR